MLPKNPRVQGAISSYLAPRTPRASPTTYSDPPMATSAPSAAARRAQSSASRRPPWACASTPSDRASASTSAAGRARGLAGAVTCRRRTTGRRASEHTGEVLVREDPEDELHGPAGVERGQGGGERRGSLRIVRAIEEHAVDLLEPPRPDRAGDAARYRLVPDGHAVRGQGAERRRGQPGVGALVRAAQPDDALPARGRDRERCADPGCLCAQDLDHPGGLVAVRHRGHARLEDACLLPRHLLDGVAEELGVVEPDAGHRGDGRPGDGVGGVESAPQAHLDHRRPHAADRELEEPEQGRELEVGEPVVLAARLVPRAGAADLADPGLEGRVVHRHAAHRDPLVEAHEVGRGVEPHPVPGGRERGRRHGAGRALAVGPGDVEHGVAPLRVAQGLERPLHALEAEAHGERPEALEVGMRSHRRGGRQLRSERTCASRSRSSCRGTMASIMPWSRRNSLRWKPGGSFSRMVCSMTRGPAKPMSALGSAS